ncbi:MAG: NAD(P)/FAD-dependent oxidoreductase, partial [Myxococcota bacterium]
MTVQQHPPQPLHRDARLDGSYDAVVVGAGPNGLAAACRLAEAGASVLVLEAAEVIGGGTRTEALTLPGFAHDVCSAAHPLGVLSPYLSTLGLERHGLTWLHPEASVAHPLDDEPAVMMWPELERTAEALGADARRYTRLYAPLLDNPQGLLADILGPLSLPHHPLLLMRFGLRALWPATWFARGAFRTTRARALFAGCAAHVMLPLNFMFTAALGVVFQITSHIKTWPVAAGGSQAIAEAMASLLHERGGHIVTGHRVRSVTDLPPARVYLFDTDPKQLISICGDQLPPLYVRRLRAFHYGMAAYKIDYALSEPIPWRDPNCLKASTVHLGGTLEEIHHGERTAWRGGHTPKPYVLVVQQSQFDPSRAPTGQHTGYAYCHVPLGSQHNATDAIEQQIERFAPGFRDTILARHTMGPQDFHGHNPNYYGGVISGGASHLWQLFTRPVARLDPYGTPHPRIFICSSSTPPGG